MCAQLFDYCYPIQILIDDFPILSNNYDKFSICDNRIRTGKYCNTLLFSTNWTAFHEVWLSLELLHNPLHRYAKTQNKNKIIVNCPTKQLVMHCKISNYASFINVYCCCKILDPIDSVFKTLFILNHLKNIFLFEIHELVPNPPHFGPNVLFCTLVKSQFFYDNTEK